MLSRSIVEIDVKYNISYQQEKKKKEYALEGCQRSLSCIKLGKFPSIARLDHSSLLWSM